MIADCILLLAAAALGYALVIAFTRMPVMPLNTVLIKSAPTNVTTAQIEDAARRAITGNFLTTDVEHAREVFGKLSWVRSASVRRAWPGSIEIELEEHEAVARWWVPESMQARMMNTMANCSSRSTTAACRCSSDRKNTPRTCCSATRNGAAHCHR